MVTLIRTIQISKVATPDQSHLLILAESDGQIGGTFVFSGNSAFKVDDSSKNDAMRVFDSVLTALNSSDRSNTFSGPGAAMLTSSLERILLSTQQASPSAPHTPEVPGSEPPASSTEGAPDVPNPLENASDDLNSAG
jgi:hypothetical protein